MFCMCENTCSLTYTNGGHVREAWVQLLANQVVNILSKIYCYVFKILPAESKEMLL